MSGEPEDEFVVIHGVKHDGVKLRPSDWIERLSSTLASFGKDQRLRYDHSVQPCIIGGEKCLVVARGLSDSNPAAYDFLMEFARSNDLRVQIDRRRDERALKIVTRD